MSLSWSCGQDYNSNTGDAVYDKGSAAPSCVTDAEKVECASIELLKNTCIAACHTNTHAHWGAFKTRQDYIAAGYISPGDKGASSLITKLINEGGNMPLSGKGLPEADYQNLLSWVNQP